MGLLGCHITWAVIGAVVGKHGIMIVYAMEWVSVIQKV